MLKNFNTSYVLVQDQLQQLKQQTMRISIHHMFWFKKDQEVNAIEVVGFQYIICFGSRTRV